MATESGPDKPGYDGGWRGAPWPRPSRVMYHRGNKKRKRLANDRDMGILVSNMRANSWLRVIRCRTGNWQPFEPGDRII